ncbi:hypothetical protein FNYG_04586 [Fusarium nygamai]|uniref:Uncharacterized protein n=1 Tax=Gibberella nygamai TaxID=42673 RepID=A0A2K0WIG0_GIBNY|nr:hypothetical protein FNYG_04586 [Fusarium nygamai]
MAPIAELQTTKLRLLYWAQKSGMRSRFAFLMLLRLKPIEAALPVGLETTNAGVRLDILWTTSHNALSGLAAFARKTGCYPVIFQEVDLVVVLEVAHVVLLAVAPGTWLPIVDLAAVDDGAGAAGTVGAARTSHTGPFLDDGSLCVLAALLRGPHDNAQVAASV